MFGPDVFVQIQFLGFSVCVFQSMLKHPRMLRFYVAMLAAVFDGSAILRGSIAIRFQHTKAGLLEKSLPSLRGISHSHVHQDSTSVSDNLAVPGYVAADWTEVEKQVPPDGGATYEFQSPDGQSIQASIPNGYGPGATFTVRYQAVVGLPEEKTVKGMKMWKVKVPEGKKQGDPAVVKVHDGPEVEFTVPHNVVGGQEVTVYYDESAPKQPGSIREETDGADDEVDATPVQKSRPYVFGHVAYVDRLMQGKWPSGAKVGQTLDFTTPDGRTVPATMPSGSRPGQEVPIHYKGFQHTKMKVKGKKQLEVSFPADMMEGDLVVQNLNESTDLHFRVPPPTACVSDGSTLKVTVWYNPKRLRRPKHIAKHA